MLVQSLLSAATAGRNNAASSHPCILKPIHAALFFSVASPRGITFHPGEGVRWSAEKRRGEGPERSPKITVMQVDRQ